MARRVFFSFHYKNDIWRVSQIRKSNITKDWEADKFLDAASWESIRRRGDSAVKDWIDRQLSGTGVTVVLIGAETAKRRYVRYEIEQSHKRGNGILGIYIHRLKNQHGESSLKGRNPFDSITTEVEESFFGFWNTKRTKQFSEIYPTYDWVVDNGYQNINRWIEDAAQKAGR
jgi:hypothetical protein